MFKIKGKYNEAIVYASECESKATEQIKTICDMEIYKNSAIRIMSDVHAGAGCTIGTTLTVDGAVTPNFVGVDIGCGMETVMIKEKQLDLDLLDKLIKRQIPCGIKIREEKHPNADKCRVFDLRCMNRIEHLQKELKAIGTLGSGNHFIEVDRDEQSNLYLVIHSGSRHLGKEVAEIYQKLAYEKCNGLDKEKIAEMIADLKAKGRKKEIEDILVNLKKNMKEKVPRELAYVSGELFDDYIHDMKIMEEFALINRKTMMQIIIEGMNLTAVEQFSTIHNYIDTEDMILRKGAVSAKLNEKLLIPINMKDGSLICTGKGNKSWNCSAPHGAGRIMSRSQAFKSLSLEEFNKAMEGIYTTTANINTLDESPMAYKQMKDIVDNIKPTVNIIKTIKPIYNFKADN